MKGQARAATIGNGKCPTGCQGLSASSQTAKRSEAKVGSGMCGNREDWREIDFAVSLRGGWVGQTPLTLG